MHNSRNIGTAGVLLVIALTMSVATASVASLYSHNSKQPAAVALAPVMLAPALLKAEAAVIYDPYARAFLFVKNEEHQLPLASLTKLMAAYSILDTLPEDQPVRITLQDTASAGDGGLKAGDIWSVGDLVRIGLRASSNDAMAAAAAAAGGDALVLKMNEEAKELGLSQSFFLDPTGLDLTLLTAGAYGSARDVAVLAAHFLEQHPEFFETTAVASSFIGAGSQAIEATSTAAPLLDIPGLIGAKTGYTRLAGGNLVAAFDIEVGRPVIAVVLHSTETARFDDMRLLLQAIREAIGDRR